PAYGKPSGERRSFDKPAYGKPSGERRSFDKPAYGQPSGERRSFDKPAYGKPSGERRSVDKPAYGKPSGERRSFDKPAYGKPSGERSFGKPAFDQPSGERRYGKPAPAGSTQEPVETTGLSISARRVALDVLGDVHQNGAFASLSLDGKLREAHLRPEDRRLVTSIVYGTLENEIRIDHALDKLMDHPTQEPVQRDILRMSAYQILFLDRVPDSAACNEGVNLVKAMGMEPAAGFINAVLRNLVRGKETLDEPKREDDLREYLHIMGSMPTWIVDKLIAAYGEEEAEKLIMQRSTEHPIVIRPNLTSMSDDEFAKLLEKKEWRYERGLAPHAFLTYGVQEMTYDKDYQDGHFTIQGQSSMLAAQAVEAKAGMKILDACAAPGGKSAYMCECMQMTGRVFAWELHEKRSLLLEGVKRRLKLDNLRISVRDATEYKQDMDRTLDAVLLDAPCSGLGVMLQKPDIKLRMKEEDVTAIVQIQKNLLETLSSYVKPGGLFVYSTCSILPEENTEQIEAFLQAHPEYTVDPLPESFPEAIRAKQTPLGVQLLSSQDGVEGFYIVRMRRKR
ncbi:MAG: 16S rRNA (cytosine(967)-C(5))-methyltransferase RsmB, partial [Clostridiales bacterium]|nr:16S rRNA (cytosine(967)-C(5))-methyltransferase RsmB [Clostridiales bacterium]